MPDTVDGAAGSAGLDDLAARLADDLGPVHWLEPAQIRARARQRRLRTTVAAPVVVILILVGGWGVWAGTDRDHGVPGVSTTGRPATPTTRASATGDQTATATPAVTGPGGFVAADDIPLEAILQSEDVGPGYQADNDHTNLPGTSPAWTFDVECPAFDNLHLTAYQRYRFMRGRYVAAVNDTQQIVFAEVERYSAADARQLMVDVKRVAQACARYTTASEASSDLHPAHAVREWSVLGSGFAGQDSLLVRQRITSVDDNTGAQVGDVMVEYYAVVRVGDLVTIVDSAAVSPTVLRQISVKAAARLCPAAIPAC